MNQAASEGPLHRSRVLCLYADSEIFGGAERALLTLVSGLDRDRWRPVVLAQPAPGLAPFRTALRELEVETVPVRAMPEGLGSVRELPDFVRRVRRVRPDVFHAHLRWPIACKLGLAGAVLARVPAIVATAHSCVDFPMMPSRAFQQRLLAGRVDRYIAVSQHVAAYLRETLPWPERKIQVIPNGIDPSSYARPPQPSLRGSLTGPGGLRVVVTIARLDEQKGHRYLLEAAQQIPKAIFVFIGDGPDRSMLEEHARSLGVADRVRFLGYRSDVGELLACADLFVLPSLREGMPLAVLEAMAAGLPVIASAIGGIDEVVTSGETGLLVDPADPPSLANAIRRLLDDSDLARRLGAAGRTRMEHEFSAARMASRTERLYQTVLAGSGVPAGEPERLRILRVSGKDGGKGRR